MEINKLNGNMYDWIINIIKIKNHEKLIHRKPKTFEKGTNFIIFARKRL